MTVWNIAKWPVMLAVVVVIVALLYYATPNVKQPKFRWISIGAVVAILIWVLASAAFGFYVANFSSYDKTYGSLAGVIVFLLWLWITNLALLFGAELDAELERGRELQAGMPAEEVIQLPARDTRKSDKAAEKERADIERGRRLRLTHGRDAATGADSPTAPDQSEHEKDAMIAGEADQQVREDPLPALGAGRQPPRRPHRRPDLPAGLEAAGSGQLRGPAQAARVGVPAAQDPHRRRRPGRHLHRRPRTHQPRRRPRLRALDRRVARRLMSGRSESVRRPEKARARDVGDPVADRKEE